MNEHHKKDKKKDFLKQLRKPNEEELRLENYQKILGDPKLYSGIKHQLFNQNKVLTVVRLGSASNRGNIEFHVCRKGNRIST